jgi:hypothetical protein
MMISVFFWCWVVDVRLALDVVEDFRIWRVALGVLDGPAIMVMLCAG